jgi:hypothetical protein
METKQIIVLEVKKEDSTFTFHMPAGATWGSAIDAAFEVLNHVSALQKNAVDNAKPVHTADQGE